MLDLPLNERDLRTPCCNQCNGIIFHAEWRNEDAEKYGNLMLKCVKDGFEILASGKRKMDMPKLDENNRVQCRCGNDKFIAGFSEKWGTLVIDCNNCRTKTFKMSKIRQLRC